MTAFGQSDWPIEVNGLVPAQPRQLSNPERSVRALLEDKGPGWRDARVELHGRFAFPVACFVFALVAVPIGAQPRRGGRAAGSLIAVILIASYYLLFVMGADLRVKEAFRRPQESDPPILLAILGMSMLPRMEQFRGESHWLRPLGIFQEPDAAAAAAEGKGASAFCGYGAGQWRSRPARSGHSRRFEFSATDGLVHFAAILFVNFLVLMGAFVFLLETFTYFDLFDDIERHSVPFVIVVDYFRYLTPYLMYQLAPLGALVAVLVTLGIMSKNNEIVAIKASGISLYRVAVPLLLAGLALAGIMIVLDDTYLPYANQRQDALHNLIKGRPPQTYTHPQRWIFGENYKVYNYDLFDPAQNLFGGLSVLEIDPADFQLRRRIFASRARWSESEKVWVLEGGWVRDFSDGTIVRYDRLPPVTSLPELTEPPSYFNREVRQAFQMSWRELSKYIDGLHRAGFDVAH